MKEFNVVSRESLNRRNDCEFHTPKRFNDSTIHNSRLQEMRRELRRMDWALGNLRGCWMTGCEEPSRAYVDGIRRRELVRRYLAADSATRAPGGLGI